mgnify:CR=1 FL=1
MKKYIYALGFFDGVHLGHGALLSACRSLAAEGGFAVCRDFEGMRPCDRVESQRFADDRKAAVLCAGLRAAGIHAEYDVVGRGLKAQMKYANKIGARYTMVLGDDEVEKGEARLKEMATGEETVTAFDALAAALC